MTFSSPIKTKIKTIIPNNSLSRRTLTYTNMEKNYYNKDKTQNDDDETSIRNTNNVDAYVRFRRQCSYHFTRMKNHLKKHCCCCCIPSDEVLALAQNDDFSSTPEIDLELQPIELVDDDDVVTLRNVSSSIYPFAAIKITENRQALNTSKLHKKTIKYIQKQLVSEFNKKTKMDLSENRQHEKESCEQKIESYEKEIESQQYFNLYVTPLSKLQWYNSWVRHCQRFNIPYHPLRSETQNFGDWLTKVQQSIQLQIFDHLLNFIDGLMIKNTTDAIEDEEQMFYCYFSQLYYQTLKSKIK